MAYRVSATEVKEIMDNCTVGDTIVGTFITGANGIVNAVFDTTDITVYKEIERWLTAHMLASTLARTTSEEKIGDASVKYTGKWGSKLESTPYGQMVLLLDTSGKMANAGKMAASIFAIPEFEE
jgi:hypothetical protein